MDFETDNPIIAIIAGAVLLLLLCLAGYLVGVVVGLPDHEGIRKLLNLNESGFFFLFYGGIAGLALIYRPGKKDQT